MVKSLSSRGLPFRGTSEIFNEPNNGNYLVALELLGKFDPFLSEHISWPGNSGSGNRSYLSFATYDEFGSILANEVVTKIVDELHVAKYFSFSVDSTPDISHSNQLSVAVRCVQVIGTSCEHFLGFLKIPVINRNNWQRLSLNSFEIMTSTLTIVGGGGQSYDNSANTSGPYSGLHARVKNVNPYARFVPCAGHSLNLVGTSAAEACREAISFFFFLQQLYNFFTASTNRFMILQKDFLESDNESTKNIKSLSANALVDA